MVVALHLLKMCVGIEDVEHLRRAQAARLARQREAGEEPRLRHVTRHWPKRAAEILAGGSLYWIIKGAVRVRQAIVAIEPATDDVARKRCALVLDPALVRTEPQPRRPHQGWRYLDSADAPPDLEAATGTDAPPELAAELRALGLL